ncbi:MAG: DUF1501 domain-containing protein [Planctomycetes bacterium]|nr:DUF1501 domain-containing protein [Planctomycetota bacterium]
MNPVPPELATPCTRRDLLGAMASLPLLRLFDHPTFGTPARRGNRKAWILVWLDGGASHLETFDCKPEAPPDIRGDLKSIPTRADGVFFGEPLGRLAKLMDRMTLFRSITHGEGQHDRASEYLLTGHRPSPVLNHPFLGVVHALGRSEDSAIPAYVAIPDAPTHGREGFLPAARGPFEVGGNPGRPDFRVHDLAPRQRTPARSTLLRQLDALDGAPRSPSEATRDAFLAQALRMTLDPKTRAVFDLGAEADAVRQRFGRHQLGQSCLLARRLVQHGSRSVLIRDVGWDHHRDIKRAMTYGFPPKLTALDQSISALVEDLERHDLADDVMVVVASEFGRTPRLNPSGGRDHWPRAQSVLAFGAGLARGAVVGSTDRKGEAPASDAISPADLHATLIAALGGDVGQTLRAPNGRPIPVVEAGGRPVRGALR